MVTNSHKEDKKAFFFPFKFLPNSLKNENKKSPPKSEDLIYRQFLHIRRNCPCFSYPPILNGKMFRGKPPWATFCNAVLFTSEFPNNLSYKGICIFFVISYN